MVLFYSAREKKLWLGTALVLTAIYSTLGLAGLLRDNPLVQEVLGLLYILSFAGILVILLIAVIRYRVKKHYSWLLLGILIAVIMVFVRMGMSPIERTHIFEYALLSALVYYALLERSEYKKPRIHPAPMAICICFCLGWLDEGLQAFLPNRTYDLRDVLFNLLSILVTIIIIWVLGLAAKSIK